MGFAQITPLGGGIGAVGIACAAFLSVLQFRSAFLQRPQAAKWLAIALVTLGTISLPMTVDVARRAIGAEEWPTLDTLLLLAIAPGFFILGLLNYAWARVHRNASTGQNASYLTPSVFRLQLAELFLVIGGASLVMAGFVFGQRNLPPSYAAHASPAQAGLVLPRGASDLCLCLNWNRNVSFHFAIDEAGFWEWARGLQLSKAGASRQVKRVVGGYTILTSSDDASSLEDHVIRQGWFYDGLHERPPIEFAYDESNGRAYYSGRDFRLQSRATEQ